jgi:hypothetical protein
LAAADDDAVDAWVVAASDVFLVVADSLATHRVIC